MQTPLQTDMWNIYIVIDDTFIEIVFNGYILFLLYSWGFIFDGLDHLKRLDENRL